ncbi:MAG: sensor histidine kinase [Planctomycetota bacterium]
MKPRARRARIFTAILVVASAAFGWYAFRTAGRDHAEAVRQLREHLESEATSLAWRIEEALARAEIDARRWLERGLGAIDGDFERGAVVALVSSGQVAYGIPPTEAASPTAQDLRYYELARLGGENYEFERRDPARALDAYAFFLDRIRAPSLRARLRLCAARAAIAAGSLELAASVAHELWVGEFAFENGWPIDLLAAQLLLALPGANFPRTTLLERLRKHASILTTPQLDLLAQQLVLADALGAEIAARRALEVELLAHRQDLTAGRAVVAGRWLFYPRADSRNVHVAAVPAALPPLAAPGLVARLEPRLTPIENSASSDSMIRDVTLPALAQAVGRIVVTDPDHASKLARLGLSRDLQRAVAITLALLVAGAGVALLAALERERRLAELRVRLLANVSHELKTPITSIRIFADLLAGESLSPDQVREYGRVVGDESRRLTQRVEDLLDFARTARGARALECAPVDVSALARQTAESFARRAREQQVAFEARIAADITLTSSALAIERVLGNLLDNALKYRGSEAPRIALDVERNGSGVRVAVIDNGIGIAPAEQARIFEEFYRVHYDNYSVQGTGLGLAISRALATRLGGRLTVESAPGRGSTFALELPG